MDVREKLVEQCEDLGTLPCCATYPKTITIIGKMA